MILRSLVGKLWLTIILLVSLVLSFLTFVLIGFFEKFYIELQVQNMTDNAIKISHIIEQHKPKSDVEYLVNNIVSRYAQVCISTDGNNAWYSSDRKGLQKIPFNQIKKDEILNNAIYDKENVSKRLMYENQENIVVGIPIKNNQKNGSVYIYQTLEPVKHMIHQTTNFVLLAAFIGFILTTFFSFFLSSKITAPLRKMREVVSGMMKGRFDMKVPIQTMDEIGELAHSFNQMSRQLNFNINALTQEKETVTNIISSMVDGVISLDHEGNIGTTNAQAVRFLRNLDNEKNSHITELTLTVELHDLFKLVVETEKKQFMEVNLDQSNWQILMSPLYNQTKIRGAVAVIRDVTEQFRLEKMRKDFIANVSHELRTPISMLQGYSEAIVDGVADSIEEMQELSQIIHDESLRMGRLVNDLLDLARMESGFTELNCQEVDIIPYLERIIRKFKNLQHDKDIEIFGEIGKVLNQYLLVDVDRIEQVLTNLIDNAIRHSKENGLIIVKFYQTEDSTFIEVSDSGVGIAKEEIPFLFDRFYKVDKARTRGRSGTGLGLSIVKNIVHAHGGKITVKSEVGKGTTFTAKFPNNLIIFKNNVE